MGERRSRERYRVSGVFAQAQQCIRGPQSLSHHQGRQSAHSGSQRSLEPENRGIHQPADSGGESTAESRCSKNTAPGVAGAMSNQSTSAVARCELSLLSPQMLIEEMYDDAVSLF